VAASGCVTAKNVWCDLSVPSQHDKVMSSSIYFCTSRLLFTTLMKSHLLNIHRKLISHFDVVPPSQCSQILGGQRFEK
jgi:hypothetical protein